MEQHRYHRQEILPQIGAAGQRRLAEAQVLLIGCGALGSVVAEQLVRAGLGRLRLVDRDLVEWTNLQRQVLFDEKDARQALPKAVAAAQRLAAVNSTVAVEPKVTDAHAANIQPLADGCQLIIDATDNAATRYLINDLSVQRGLPWIYGACIGTEGRVMVLQPPNTACLRCIYPQPPGAGELPTCDTAGVLGPAAAVVGALQAALALRLLVSGSCPDQLLSLDVWAAQWRAIQTTAARSAGCPCCGLRRFEFLEATEQTPITLCGRQAIQVRGTPGTVLDLPQLAQRWSGMEDVQLSSYLLRGRVAGANQLSLTVFADGRTIVHGTDDPGRARSLVARFVGS